MSIFSYLLAIFMSPLEDCLFRSLAYFLIRLLVFSTLSFRNSFYVALGFSPWNSTRYKDKYIRGDLLYELTHMVMEAKKSHNLPSASWEPIKLVYNSLWVQRSENQELLKSKGRRKTDVPAQEERLLFHIFDLIKSSMDWMMPACRIFFTHSTDYNTNFSQKHSQTHPENDVIPVI